MPLSYEQLFQNLEGRIYHDRLTALYGPENAPHAQARAIQTAKAFLERYKPRKEASL